MNFAKTLLHRSLVCLCGLLCFENNAYAQYPSSIDSMLHIAGTLRSGPGKVDILNELAFHFIERDTAQAGKFAAEALSMAIDLNYRQGVGDSQMRLGKLAEKASAYALAEERYLAAKNIRQSLGLTAGVANCYINLGNLFKSWGGKYGKAIEYYQDGIAALGDLNTREAFETRAKLLHNLGDAYWKLQKKDEAIKAYEDCILIRKKLGDERGIANTQINLASLFFDIEDTVQAESLLENSLEIFKGYGDEKGLGKVYLQLGNAAFFRKEYESSIARYKQALELEGAIETEDYARLIRNIGSALVNLNREEEALQLYREALPVFQERQNKEEIASLYFEFGNVYLNQERYDSAAIYYRQSLDTLKNLSSPRLESEVLFHLSTALKELKKYEEALIYSEEYNLLASELFTSDREFRDNNFMAFQDGINLKFDIIRLNERVRFLVVASAIGFVILGLSVSIALLFAYLARAKRLLAEQDAQIAYQRVDEVLMTKELEANYARLDGQDAERKRIAQELHDHIGAMLTVVKLHLEGLRGKIDEVQLESREQFQKTQELLDTTTNEVRRISHELGSGILEKFGLKSQLESFIDDLKAPAINVELVTFGLEARLPVKVEIQIFRIVQELVNNALKHSRATALSVQVNRFKSTLNVMVEDDGVGFDPVLAIRKGGAGIRNLQSRVNQLGGVMNIDSQLERGSIISIDVPVSSFENEKIQDS